MEELLTDAMLGWVDGEKALICDPHASMGPTVRASREDSAKLRNWLTAWLGEDTATTLAELDRMAESAAPRSPDTTPPGVWFAIDGSEVIVPVWIRKRLPRGW